MFTSMLLLTVLLPVDELFVCSAITTSIDELLACSAVTTSKSFLFLFVTSDVSETQFSRNFRLSRNFTLLLCFISPLLSPPFFFLFFLLASYSFSFFFFSLSFRLLSFSLRCCFFLVSFPCSICKHSALVSNLAFGLDHFDRLTEVTCGI